MQFKQWKQLILSQVFPNEHDPLHIPLDVV